MYPNPWSFSQERGKNTTYWTFTLRGNEPAHEVKWDAEPYDPKFTTVEELPTEMLPGDAVRFRWFKVGPSPSSIRLTVSWRRPGETERRESRATLM